MKTKVLSCVGVFLASAYTATSTGQQVVYAQPGRDSKAEIAKPDQAGGLFEAYKGARQDLLKAAEFVIKNTQTVQQQQGGLEDQMEKLLDAISKKPQDYNLQREFCDAMVKYIDLILGTIAEVKQQDLSKKRERVVSLLNGLAGTLEDHSKLTQQRISSAIDETKPYISTLFTTEGKLVRAYRANAESYSRLDIEGSLKKLDSYVGDLRHGRETVMLIRDAMVAIGSDAGALETLKELKVNLDKLSQLFYRFGEELHNVINVTPGPAKETS